MESSMTCEVSRLQFLEYAGGSTRRLSRSFQDNLARLAHFPGVNRLILPLLRLCLWNCLERLPSLHPSIPSATMICEFSLPLPPRCSRPCPNFSRRSVPSTAQVGPEKTEVKYIAGCSAPNVSKERCSSQAMAPGRRVEELLFFSILSKHPAAQNQRSSIH